MICYGVLITLSYNYECFVLRITDTTKMYHLQKSARQSISTVVFAINDSRMSCKLMIPCRLNRERSYKNNGSWRSQRTLSLRKSNYLISVLGQWDPSFFRGCGKLIQLHLS